MNNEQKLFWLLRLRTVCIRNNMFYDNPAPKTKIKIIDT